MTSPFGKDMTAKNIECYAQEKCPRTSFNSHDLIQSLTEITQLDQVDFNRMSSPTNSAYSDARNSVTAFSCIDGCFGDSRVETSPKSEKDISLLGEKILKQIFTKRNFTTAKITHVDIAPESERSKNNGESFPKGLSENNQINMLKNKVSDVKVNCGAVLEDDSSKEFHGVKTDVTIPKKIRFEDTCDGETTERWSRNISKLHYFRRPFDEASSTESINQYFTEGEHYPNYKRRQSFSPKVSTRMRKIDIHSSREMVESFAQTDNPNEKSKKESKFKKTVVQLFLSCVKCFM